jgi:hypothetical protein
MTRISQGGEVAARLFASKLVQHLPRAGDIRDIWVCVRCKRSHMRADVLRDHALSKYVTVFRLQEHTLTWLDVQAWHPDARLQRGLHHAGLLQPANKAILDVLPETRTDSGRQRGHMRFPRHVDALVLLKA